MKTINHNFTEPKLTSPNCGSTANGHTLKKSSKFSHLKNWNQKAVVDYISGNRLINKSFRLLFFTVHITSAQYCCLVSESMCAKPPSTRAFIRDLCTELDSRWRGGLRLANCFARFHQLSHCTTMLALNRQRGRQSVRVCAVVGADVTPSNLQEHLHL